jgi:prolyl oligopeptidase
MTRRSLLVFPVLLAVLWNCGPAIPCAEDFQLNYPPTRRCDQIDVYHGVPVPDPYRWLEDPDSDETAAWVAAQNEVTFRYLEQIAERKEIKQRLTELWDYERFGLPYARGGRYFFTHNDGLQDQSVLHVADSLQAPPRVLLDPNTLSDDGTVALAGWAPSEDGRYLAYGLAADGSDWREWRVKSVTTGEDLPDLLQWIKFSGVAWTPDGRGFFYSRYDQPAEDEQFTETNYYQKLYYHRLGETQDRDQLIYERQDQKEWGFDGQVSEDGRYLVITVWRSTERKNQVFLKSLEDPDAQVVELLSGFDAEYAFLGNNGSLFWFMTDDDAPLRRVIAVDIAHPDRDHWNVVIPEADDVIRGISLVGDRFIVRYLQDARSRVRVFDLAGKPLHDVTLPAIGSAGGFEGRRKDTETFYAFTNDTTPTTIYRYDVRTGTSTVFREPRVDFDPAAYQTEQVFFRSTDGTRLPMFITSKKDLPRDGDNPAVLYGYGGFNVSLTPGFSVSNLVWLEMGGVYAVPNLRGGGEYGRAWHEAGMLEKKQNVFDDFIAAAEWLIDNGFTRAEKLAMRGGSNGGLLVGAMITQRPDLFAAAIPSVGVMDMLRYHKFTIGWAWVSEFGCSDDQSQFQNLFRYSPLHNLKCGTTYPATMVTTADHDDRVVPGHSFKFAAALQHAHRGDPPVLIRIETSAGHGAGTPTAKRIDAAADSLAFLISVIR